MNNILVAFPKAEDGKKIARLLAGYGFFVDQICTTAAQALGEMNQYSGGVIICGYRLPDMFYSDLLECMPSGFEMLLLASERILGQLDSGSVVSLSLPVSACDLTETLQMMLRPAKSAKSGGRKKRSLKEQQIIDQAKHLLMERNHLAEAEAYRYLQKHSMNNGTSLAETAQMVLTLMEFERRKPHG